MKRPSHDDPQETFVRSIVNNDIRLVKRMILDDHEVDTADYEGRFPLHYAAVPCNIEITRILLDHGATVDCTDRNGNTPLSDAVFYSAGKLELIQLLLQRGAAMNRENLHGVTPQILAQSIADYDYSECFPID